MWAGRAAGTQGAGRACNHSVVRVESCSCDSECKPQCGGRYQVSCRRLYYARHVLLRERRVMPSGPLGSPSPGYRAWHVVAFSGNGPPAALQMAQVQQMQHQQQYAPAPAPSAAPAPGALHPNHQPLWQQHLQPSAAQQQPTSPQERSAEAVKGTYSIQQWQQLAGSPVQTQQPGYASPTPQMLRSRPPRFRAPTSAYNRLQRHSTSTAALTRLCNLPRPK